MKSSRLHSLITATVLWATTLASLAQSTAFTYQGRLADSNGPVTGSQDFEFRLFNAASGGAQIGSVLTLDDLGVTNGLFTATLDFGANFPGADRFLQIAVRPGASTGAYATLSPRQPITATPYAVKALEAAGLPAGAVSGAMLADGAVTSSKLAPGAVSQLGASDGSPVNAVQVNTNGLVGIGTNAPQAGLHIGAGRSFINLEVLRTFADDPDESGGFTNLYGASAIAVDGDLMAVVAIYDSGVTLFDVSNPSNPLFRAQFRSGDSGFAGLQQVHRAALQSNLLAVASYDGTVSLLNVSNRYAPVMVAQLADGQGGWNELSGINSLAFSGSLLAIAAREDSAVTLVDVSNPANPIKRAELKDGFFGFTNLRGASALAFKGNTLFIGADQDEAVTVVDVSNPASPNKLAELRSGVGGYLRLGYITSIAVSGNTLAVGGTARLTLVDVANPGAPIRLVQLDASTQPAMAGYLNSLRFSGSILAVADAYLGKVALLDVTQPASPIEIAATKNGGGALTTQNSFSDVALIGTNLFVTYRDANAVSIFRLAPRPAGLVTEGWVGIGISRPTAALHVVGNLVVESAEKVAINASAVSVGFNALASGSGATALGNYAVASGNYGTALGSSAQASGNYATALGSGVEARGFGSTALGFNTDATGPYATAMGIGTAAAGRSSTALGESSAALGDYSMAAGLQARATNTGSFVWADGQGIAFTSTADNQFLIRASGNVGINKNNPATALDVNGTVTAAGFTGNGSGLTALNAGTLTGAVPPATLTSVPAGSLTGSVPPAALTSVPGANLTGAVPPAALTSVPAGNLTGSVADARLSANVALLNASQTFGGANNFNAGVTLNPPASLSFGSQTRQMINLWSTNYALGVQGSAGYFRSGGDFFWFLGGSHSDANANAGSGGVPLMSLKSSGRLGLGTTAPDYPLDVQSGQAVGRFTSTNNLNGAVLILRNTAASPTYLAAINFEDATTTPGQIGYLASGQMSFRVAGGERMNLQAGGLTVNGAVVLTSDRNAKADFAAVDAQEVLEKVAALPLQSWSYTNRPGVKHVGPMAQDFRAAFGLGEDDKHIATVDADGVALAAIQGLNQKLEASQRENSALKERVEKLEHLLQKLVTE